MRYFALEICKYLLPFFFSFNAETVKFLERSVQILDVPHWLSYNVKYLVISIHGSKLELLYMVNISLFNVLRPNDKFLCQKTSSQS